MRFLDPDSSALKSTKQSVPGGDLASAATCSQTLLASRSVRAGRRGKGVGDTKVHFRKPSGLLSIASLIEE